MLFLGLIVVISIVLIVTLLTIIKWILPNAISTKLSNKLNAEVTIGRLVIKWNFLRLWTFSLTLVIYDANITYYVEEKAMSNILDNDDLFDLNKIIVIKDFFNFTKFQAIQINNLSVLMINETNIDSAQFGKLMCLYACAKELHFNRPRIENSNNLLLNIDVKRIWINCFKSDTELNIIEARQKTNDLLAEINFDLTMNATLILHDPVVFKKLILIRKQSNILITDEFSNMVRHIFSKNHSRVVYERLVSIMPREFIFYAKQTTLNMVRQKQRDLNLSLYIRHIFWTGFIEITTINLSGDRTISHVMATFKCGGLVLRNHRKELAYLQDMQVDINKSFYNANINLTLRTLHVDYNHETMAKWLSTYSTKTSKRTETASIQKQLSWIVTNFKKLLQHKGINIIAEILNISGEISFKKKKKLYTFSVYFNSMHINSAFFSEQEIYAKLEIKQFGWSFNEPAWELPNWDDMHVLDRSFYVNNAQFVYGLNKNGGKITIICTSLMIELTNMLAKCLFMGINAVNKYWPTNELENSQQDNQIMLEVSLLKANCFIKLSEDDNKYLLLSSDRIDVTKQISKQMKLQHCINYKIRMYESKLVLIQPLAKCYIFAKLAAIKNYKIYSEIVEIDICNKEQKRSFYINLLEYTHIQWCPKSDNQLFALISEDTKRNNTFGHFTKPNAEYFLNINGNLDLHVILSEKYSVKLTFDQAAKKYIGEILNFHFNQTIPFSNFGYMLFGKNTGVRLNFEQVKWSYMCMFVELCRPLPVKNNKGFIVAFDDLFTDHSGIVIGFKLLNLIFSPSKETWTEFWDGVFKSLKYLFTPQKAIQQ